MQAAVDAWITPAATAEFQLQAGEAANTCTLHATPAAAAASAAAAAGVSAAMPLGNMPPPAPSAATAAKGAAAGLQDRLLPMQPVERQGSLADLLFEILDDGDTDDLLLADLNKSSKAAAAAQQQQLRAQLNAGSQMQQQQPPLLQQLQQRKLLERLQASKPGDAADMFAMREQLSNGTSSSLAASQTGAGASPWPSFTSAAGQAGPGAAALFSGSTPDAAQAAAAQDASTALLQQLQLRGQQGGPASSLPALKAAAGVAESALLQRQAMKQQQQQGTGDTPMPAAADTAQQQQQPQQQGDALPAEQAAAAAAPAAAAVDAVGGNCSAATAAALLAEGGDDLSLDLDFLESMLQDTNTGDFKVLGDLARMVSLPVGMNSPLVGLQQQQQPAAAAAAGSGPSSLAADMNQAALMQQQGLGDLGSATALQPMDMSAAAAAAGVSAFSGAAAAGGAFPMVPGPGPAGAGCLPDAAPSMDSGIRSTMNHLGRLQIPSPVGDLGLAGSLQAPMSVDAARPGADQGLAAARAGNLQQMLAQQQGLAAGGMAAGASGKPPLPACSSRSGVGPSNSVPEESDGSVEVDTAEAMSDGEVEQAAGGRRTSARRRSRLALAKHKKQQQKAQQAADAAAAAQAGATAAAAAAGPQGGGAAAPDAAAQSQPQVVPGGMLQLLLNGSSSASMGPSPAGVSAQMQQLDIMQQQQPQQQHQQLLMQSYGSAPNLGFEGPLSPAMLGTAASTGQIGLQGPASGGLDLATIPRKQLTAVLATLAPNALQQLLQLQQRQPALARVVLKRALQQLQQQQELGIQHQGLESLLGGLGHMDGLGMGPAGAATPTASGAAGGMPSGLNQRPPSDPQGRRNKAPLVFYRQRGSKAMTNMGGKPTSQQAQRAGSAPVGDGKDHLMSPQAAAAAAAGGLGFDPAMAAAMCGGAGPAPSAAAAAGEGGQHGSLSSSDMASSDGAPPHPHAQQPSGSSRRLGKRGRQITQNDLSGAVAAAAAAAAGGGNNPLDSSAGALPTAQSSGALPYLPGGQQGLQMQMQHGGLPDGMQQLGGGGLEDPAARAEQRGQVSGLSALFRQPGGSTATASTGSAGGSADAAVITQQARALVRILTKLNTAQLVQTRTMLHSVLQRSAPGLLDHMGAIERMITQLINLKQSQPSLPQQQQQQLLMQGAFGPGGSMFAAGGGGGMGMNMNAGFGLDETLMAQQQQQQQQQQQGQMQAAGMLQQQQQQQQQHMMAWANDPFVQHQLQQPQGQAQRQQQLLQAQMQAQQQQQSPWGIASSLSGPQPLQWNAQQSMVQPDPAAAGAEGGAVGTEFDADQSPYQLATRRQQGRRTKAKPDKQQAQQQQAAAASGLQMAASAPVGLHAQASPVGAVDATGRGMAMSQQQQQQQMGMLAELQQQQRMQQMQLQQGLMMGGSLAPQQQQQAATAGQLQMQVPRDPLAGAGAGDGLLLDAAQERQQEDMLLSWLQNDALEDWPEGKDVMGVLS